MTAISSQLLCGAPRPGEWRRFREQRRGDGQQQQQQEGVRGHGGRGHHHYRELRRGRPSQLLRGAAAPPSLEKPSDFSGDKFGRLQDTGAAYGDSSQLPLAPGVRNQGKGVLFFGFGENREITLVLSPTALALDRQDITNY